MREKKLNETELNEMRALRKFADSRDHYLTAKQFAKSMGYGGNNKYSPAQAGMVRLNFLHKKGYLVKIQISKSIEYGRHHGKMIVRYSFCLSELGIYRLFHYETNPHLHGSFTYKKDLNGNGFYEEAK